jgi:hypothetical protein
MKTGVIITKAEYLEHYQIRLTFSDNKENIFDFESLVNSNKLDCSQFKDILKFKQFYIENGELVFNDNWDMLIPIVTLYHKNKITFSGRPKKDTCLIRIRVPSSHAQDIKNYIEKLKNSNNVQIPTNIGNEVLADAVGSILVTNKMIVICQYCKDNYGDNTRLITNDLGFKHCEHV